MNLFWKIILGIAALITLWFVGKSTHGLYRHFTLSAQAPATIESWEVEQLSASKFAYEVSYHFTVKEKVYKKKELLKAPRFQNQYAAETELPRLQDQIWIAHYAPSNPQNSSLENPFPLKNLLYALICLAIFFYFFWLYMRYRATPTDLD